MTLGLRVNATSVKAKFKLRVLRWQGGLLAKVNKNAILGYSDDQG